MTRTSTIKALIASLLLIAPAANAVILDFEGFSNGTIMGSQNSNVVISATNLRNGSDKDWAVIFDSSPGDINIFNLNNTSDSDLMADFDSNNAGLADDYDPGNILIIQENNTDCGANNSTTCSRPDDQAGSKSSPAGYITFEFAKAVNILSLDYFDVETNENEGDANSQILFYDDSNSLIDFGTDYFAPDTGGNKMWDRVLFDGVMGVRKIEVRLVGSGAIDRLEYSVGPVPAAFWLFGTALLGFIGFSRKTAV